MSTPEEVRQIASKIALTLDNPASVKQQVKQIAFAQKQLRVIKKELSVAVRKINQQAAQASADSFLSVLEDITGHRKVAGRLRANKRRRIEREKKVVRQPSLEFQAAIDNLILEGDRLKLLAQEYLLDPIGVKAPIQVEEEQRRLEEEQRRHKAEKIKKQAEKQAEIFVFIILVFAVIAIPVTLLLASRNGITVDWFSAGVAWFLLVGFLVGWFIKQRLSSG